MDLPGEAEPEARSEGDAERPGPASPSLRASGSAGAEPTAVAAAGRSTWGDVLPFDIAFRLGVTGLPRFENPLVPNVREARLLNDAPWTRGVGPLEMRVQTEGWKF